MKKILLALLILIIIGGGVYFMYRKNAPMTSQPTPPPAQAEQMPPAATPSFQDGEFYLQALKQNDITLCVKIGNEKLKERCEQDLTPKKS